MGTGTYNTELTKVYTLEAMNLGADACLIVTPYYNKPPQKALINHYKSIAEEIQINAKNENIDILPMIIYNDVQLQLHNNIQSIIHHPWKKSLIFGWCALLSGTLMRVFILSLMVFKRLIPQHCALSLMIFKCFLP